MAGWLGEGRLLGGRLLVSSGGRKGPGSFGSLFYKGGNLIHEALHSRELSTSQRPQLLGLSYWELKFQPMNFGGAQTFRPCLMKTNPIQKETLQASLVKSTSRICQSMQFIVFHLFHSEGPFGQEELCFK